jgi:hypothetical protein
VPPLTLRQTRALSDPATGAEDAAEGATAFLVLDGDTIAYVPDPKVPGRYRPVDSTTIVPAGVSFRLAAAWNGVQARAEGRTPPRIGLREVCLAVPEAPVEAILVDSVRRDSLDIPAEQGFLYPIDVTMAWPSPPPPNDTTYWVRGQLRPSTSLQSGGRVVNFFLQPAVVQREADFRAVNGQRGNAPQHGPLRQWTGVYAVPVDDSSAALPAHALTVDLVRGPSDFGAFATSRTDPDARAPISNVRGALGIATAVALDSLRHGVDQTGRYCFPLPAHAQSRRSASRTEPRPPPGL